MEAFDEPRHGPPLWLKIPELRTEHVDRSLPAVQPAAGILVPGAQLQAGSGKVNMGSNILRPEQVIDKLTQRITDRLRNELRVELQRETQDLASQAATVAAQQDAFLARELEAQNTCPVCYELMVPPRRAPQLLFPCGHTFCTACITSYCDKDKKQHCPVCRKKIESRALNYPLQQLIQSWVARRDAGKLKVVDDTSVGKDSCTDECFTHESSEGGSEQIRRRCEQVGLRLRVLRNELLDVIAEQEAVSSREASAATVTQHLVEAEQQAQARLKAAQAEVDLVRAQVHEQQVKAQKIADQAARLSASRALLVATISPLEEEEAKLRILVDGLNEGLNGR